MWQRLPQRDAHVLVRDLAQRHSYRDQYHIGFSVPLSPERPADDAAGVEIQHHREVQPAFLSPDVGEVGDPALVGSGRLELPIQQVRGDRVLGSRAVVERQPAPLAARLQARSPHQAGHPMLAAGITPGAQVAPHARTALGAIALIEAGTVLLHS